MFSLGEISKKKHLLKGVGSRHIAEIVDECIVHFLDESGGGGASKQK